MLDTTRSIPTPEGIDLGLTLAGPVPRALAWAIDFLLRLAIFVVAAIALAPTGMLGRGVLMLIAFLLEWLYPTLCEVLMAGATPGKKMLGLRVLHDDGTPVGWTAALTRNVVRAVDFLPLLYGFGLASMLASRDFKRLGDLAAGTVVVHQPRAARTSGIAHASPATPRVVLDPAEQRAVLDFAERSPTLTDDRAAEIAEIALPLIGAARGAQARAELIAVANHLIGRR